MANRIFRAFQTPKRDGISWEERWKGPDQGLITAWEIGREIAEKDPELAARAKNGELPPSDWKGGVEKSSKLKRKFGTLWYLAEWMGLRGEDLDIDVEEEKVIVCSKTGEKVTFTLDYNKYAGK